VAWQGFPTPAVSPFLVSGYYPAPQGVDRVDPSKRGRLR
jgi:hypothetical protein